MHDNHEMKITYSTCFLVIFKGKKVFVQNRRQN